MVSHESTDCSHSVASLTPVLNQKLRTSAKKTSPLQLLLSQTISSLSLVRIWAVLKARAYLLKRITSHVTPYPWIFFIIIIVFSELSMNSVERAFCTPPPQPLPPSFPPTSKSGLVTCAPPLHNYHTITHVQSSFYKVCF